MKYLSLAAIALALSNPSTADPAHYKDTASLIKQFEGVRKVAYLDSGDVPTIGAGITASSPCLDRVYLGMQISDAEVDALLECHVDYVQRELDGLIQVSITPNQRAALASFVFNVGVGNFSSSTLLKLLNEGDYEGAAAQFDRWIWDDGAILPGLVARRAVERALFETP